MKKIAVRVSDEYLQHQILIFLNSTLKKSQIETLNFSISSPLDPNLYQGYILFTTATDAQKNEGDISNFHLQSKPILVFAEASFCVAKILRKFKPAIAIQEVNNDSVTLNKLGIETEVCPVDDFITDRYTKIISSTILLSNFTLDMNIEKGLRSLCKELVEIS
jgi:enhancing lycopene biosynthesis protein 2